MTKMILGTLALVALLAAPQASALTVEGSARTEQLQGWADRSRLPLPDLTVEVVDGGCPAFDKDWISCAYPEQERVYLWTGATRRIWLHEAWHVVEGQLFTDDERAQATALMGMTGPWKNPDADREPVECFADVAADLSVFKRLQGRRYFGDRCQKVGIRNRRAMRQLIRRAVAS